MANMTKTTIEIDEAVYKRAEVLAQQLDLSGAELIERAIAQFISAHEQSIPPERVVHQGDIYWVQFDDTHGVESSIPHPCVIVQADVLNHSRIHTVVVCAITSNLKRGTYPGNVLLDVGEGDLPKQSVVEVSKVSSIYKTQLGEPIGSLSQQRVEQILAGMRFVQTSYFRG